MIDGDEVRTVIINIVIQVCSRWHSLARIVLLFLNRPVQTAVTLTRYCRSASAMTAAKAAQTQKSKQKD